MRAVAKVDSKGRVTLPLFVRELVGIRPEMYVVIEVDRDRNTITLKPLISGDVILVDLEVEVGSPERIQDVVRAVVEEGAEVRYMSCMPSKDSGSVCVVTVGVVDMKAAQMLRKRMERMRLKVTSVQPVQRKVVG